MAVMCLTNADAVSYDMHRIITGTFLLMPLNVQLFLLLHRDHFDTLWGQYGSCKHRHT